MKTLNTAIDWARRNPYALIVIWAGLFFFVGLSSFDLISPDEPRYGLVAKEMIGDGRFLMPFRNQEPYPDKPPLFFWLIALFSLVSGGEVTALTARLPSALAATAVLVMMYRFLRRQDETLAAVTVFALPVCYKFFYQAHAAQIDMLLCCCTTGALLGGYRYMTGESKNAALPGLLMGLGILAKGPVGYLIPAGGLLLFAAFKGRDALGRFPKRMLLWGLLPPLLWLSGLLIEVVISNQWAYLENLLFKQTVVRYLNPWHHYRPWYYFPKVFSYEFLPWTFFLLSGLPWTRSARAGLSDLQRFCWAVVVFTFIFFSLSKGKRDLYLLPLYPFACVLAALEIRALLKAPVVSLKRRLLVWGPIALVYMLVGAALAAVTLGLAPSPVPDHFDSSPPLIIALFALVTLLSGLGVSVTGVWSHRPRLALGGTASGMLALVFMTYLIVFPWVGPHRSARIFSEEAHRVMLEKSGVHTPLAMVFWRSAYVFYGLPPMLELGNQHGKPFDHLPRLEDFFANEPRGWVIIRESDLCDWQEVHNYPVEIHYQRRVGRGQLFYLVSGDPIALEAEP